jgi:hypothetical protein
MIFQEACKTENIEAKFGRTLPKEENIVRKFILSQTPVLGRIPSIIEINKSFPDYSDKKVNTILNKLDQVDVIYLGSDKSTIDVIYPFSGSKTAHKVTLKINDYKQIYAMCAIDALGICFMFNCDVFIESQCHHCGEKVEIEIQNNKIIKMNQKDLVVWCDMEYSCCAATSLCKNINFFSSESHFKEWQNEKHERKGALLQIQEAYYLGKAFFEKRL